MNNASALPKKLIVFGIVLPLAIFLGYLLSSPDFESLAMVGLFTAVLLIPLFLRWHHLILIVTWNLTMTLFFLPGNPPMWMLASIISLSLTVLGRILNKDLKLQFVPSVSWSLLALGLVVLITMKATGGGIGLRALGSSNFGAKKYFFILFAIAGYFALSAQRLSIQQAKPWSSVFFLSGLTPVLSNVLYMLPSLWILYSLFPVDYAISQASEDMSSDVGGQRIGRVAGMSSTGVALFSFMLLRYQVRGILDLHKPWRLLLFLAIIVLSLYGGFRSVLILFVTLFSLQFYFEGLHRTRMFPILLVMGTLGLAGLIPFAQKLPLSIQRCLSVLPIPVNPGVRIDAQSSTEWRLRMWDVLVPEISRYFWLGKGYTASATDYYLSYESTKRGFSADYDTSLIAGDYHSGPLSILIPFGIFGVISFLCFIVAALRVLYLNYRDSDPSIKGINTFLLAYFSGKIVFFLLIFGASHSDLILLAGVVGLSLTINGVASAQRKRVISQEAKPALPHRPAFGPGSLPGWRRPA